MILRPDLTVGETTVRFRTVANLQEALERSMTDSEKYRRLASITGGFSFTGTHDAAEYIRMLREGWPQGVQGVEGLDGLSTDAAERLTFVRNVGGAFPIVPAYLSGAPDSMLMPTPDKRDNVRGLTLVIDSSYHCGIDAKTCLAYAKSVMRLVAWLQAEQIETAIYLSIALMSNGHKLLYVIPVREAGEIMMPERIAALVHPSGFRRGFFAMLEREHYDYELVHTSICKHAYGYPTTATPDEMRTVIPEAYSVIMLPKVGSGDPLKAVQESETFKLRREL